MNEVEHDIENCPGRGLRYPPKPKAEVDSTNRGLDDSQYHAKTEFSICFIRYSNKKKTKKNSNVGYVIGYTNGAHENFNENIIRNNFFKCSLDASMFLR